MSTYTAAEIKQAQESPRAGDVWEKDEETRNIVEVLRGTNTASIDVRYKSTRRGRSGVRSGAAYLPYFQRWTRNATLVNRGPA